MGYIIINKDKGDMEHMRRHMYRSMTGGHHLYEGSGTMMRDHDNEEHMYRMGYRHGWEDHEADTDEHYRRQRDSRGRFI